PRFRRRPTPFRSTSAALAPCPDSDSGLGAAGRCDWARTSTCRPAPGLDSSPCRDGLRQRARESGPVRRRAIEFPGVGVVLPETGRLVATEARGFGSRRVVGDNEPSRADGPGLVTCVQSIVEVPATAVVGPNATIGAAPSAES